MKSATVSDIKKELKLKSEQELIELNLRLAKFKKENKELLTYLLYEADDEHAFVEQIKEEVEEFFEEINISSYYFIKKSVRKILRHIKKHARYSLKKETEIELLIHFCKQLKKMEPSYQNNVSLRNIYERQLYTIKKNFKGMHEDLVYDYQLELNKLKES